MGIWIITCPDDLDHDKNMTERSRTSGRGNDISGSFYCHSEIFRFLQLEDMKKMRMVEFFI